MRFRPLVAAIVLAVALACASGAVAVEPSPLPDRLTLQSARSSFLAFAEQGLDQTQQLWWSADLGWYKSDLDGNPKAASLWWSFPLLEATAATAIADPSPANKQRVRQVFAGAERYWDPTLEGTGGVSALWGVSPSYHGFFDDAGWWGLAYLDAYRATGDKRWRTDAEKALDFIDRYGWDKRNGGIWWDTSHTKKTAEPLAAATLIAATLYRIEHKQRYLQMATRYLVWANANTRNPAQDNLYGRNATDKTVMDYVQGMMIAAHVELCVATGKQGYCSKAEALADASLRQFPMLADWAPETDVVYLRGIYQLYEQDHDPRRYAQLYANAQAAAANARDAEGFWSKRWDGGWTDPGRLYTQAATLELFAWAAAAAPPPALPAT